MAAVFALFMVVPPCWSQSVRGTETYRRIKAQLDAVPAIDTHDHLWPFDRLCTGGPNPGSEAMDLSRLWQHTTLSWIHPLTSRAAGEPFDYWWTKAKGDFVDVRATSFYRCMLPAFSDLYGVDFDRITDAQARDLDRRLVENYRDPRWLYQVITERANVELVFTDPYWDPLRMKAAYPFEVVVLNINSLVSGFHSAESAAAPLADPYRFAANQGIRVKTLDDYLDLIDRLFAVAKANGAACAKQTLAYTRSLRFENVSKGRAATLFGRPKSELTWEQLVAFQDFMMWRIVELCAKYDMPLQIHTGLARIQGSNPMLLADLIEANPRTKFVLFHGGFPWVGETGAMAMKYASHVWVDCVWLPMLSYSTAKRAFHEWLEVMPSDHILWGSDTPNAEGLYGAAEIMRRCWSEVLAEKVEAGQLTEEDAMRIGRQIFRENALALFPRIREQLWKHKMQHLVPTSQVAG